MEFEWNYECDEAETTLRKVFSAHLSFSRKKPVFAIRSPFLSRFSPRPRCFEGSPLDLMKNTKFLEKLPQFEALMEKLNEHADMASLRKLWIAKYDQIKEEADLVELPYDEECFREGILTQEEIDAMLSGL